MCVFAAQRLKNRTPDSFIKHCYNAKAGREPEHWKLDHELTKLQAKFTDPAIINILKKYKATMLEECKKLMNGRPRQNAPLESSVANTTEQVTNTLQNDDYGAFQ